MAKSGQEASLPGRRARLAGEMTLARILMLAVAAWLLGHAAVAAEWRRYADPQFGYSVQLPDDGFEVETSPERNGVTLFEIDGRGQIDVYAVEVDQQQSLAEIRRTISEAERIREVTYSHSGKSWFVLSGYYQRTDDEATDLIFYAKFLLSPDRRTLSAFEASYPVADKEFYDPIIERIEDTLTRPNSGM